MVIDIKGGMYMKIKVPNKNYGITELYDIIATSIGKDITKIKYDCRYITC